MRMTDLPQRPAAARAARRSRATGTRATARTAVFLAGLDLSRARALLNGSEPILPATLDRFAAQWLSLDAVLLAPKDAARYPDFTGPVFLVRGVPYEWRGLPMGAVYSSAVLDVELRRRFGLGPRPPRDAGYTPPVHGPWRVHPLRGTAESPLIYADDIAVAGSRAACDAFVSTALTLDLPWKTPLAVPSPVPAFLGVDVALDAVPTPTLSVASRLRALPPLPAVGRRMPTASLSALVGWAAWACGAVRAPAPPVALLRAAATDDDAVLIGSELRDAWRRLLRTLSVPWHSHPIAPLSVPVVVHCDAAHDDTAPPRVACVVAGRPFARAAAPLHITALELDAMVLGLRHAPAGAHVRLVTDSAVAAIAAVRGGVRGSAPSDLRAPLDRLLAAAAARPHPTAVAWVPTCRNRADDPSRGRPLPPALGAPSAGRFVGYIPYPATATAAPFLTARIGGTAVPPAARRGPFR